MGAWGMGLLDNDAALDFVADWDDFVAPQIAERSWDGAKVWTFLRRMYFREGLNPHDTESNSELLAIAALYARHKLSIPGEMKDALERAISAELQADVLDAWDDPKERKKALCSLLKDIGRKRLKTSELEEDSTAFTVEIENLKPFTDQLDRWADVVSPPHQDEDFERLYPSFLDSVEKVLTIGIKPRMLKTDPEEELVKLRFMIMAFYVAWKTERSADEIRTVVRQAEATGGSFFMALDVGGADG